MKESFVIQFAGKEKTKEELTAQALQIWIDAGNKKSAAKKIALYVQPETDKVYFVVNDEFEGNFDL